MTTEKNEVFIGEGGIKNWWGWESTGGDSAWWEMNQILTVEGGTPHPPSRENLECSSKSEAIMKALDNANFACGIIVDLQKTFDTVGNSILNQISGNVMLHSIQNISPTIATYIINSARSKVCRIFWIL